MFVGLQGSGKTTTCSKVTCIESLCVALFFFPRGGGGNWTPLVGFSCSSVLLVLPGRCPIQNRDSFDRGF